MASAPKKPVTLASTKPVAAPAAAPAFKPVAAPAPAPAVKPVPAPAASPAVKPVVATKTAATPVAALKSTMDDMKAQAATAQETMRKAAEKGLAQSKSGYDRVKTATEEANVSLGASIESATKGMNIFNAKAMEALRNNSEVMFDFVKALAGVKSVAEAVTLQTETAKRSYETLTAQNKELVALAQKAALEAIEPLKASFAKATKVAL